MPELKLARIDPVHTRTASVQWEQRRGRGQQRHERRPTTARLRLLAALLPGRDPETCEFDVDLDANGAPKGIVVRERGSGAVLLRLGLDQIAMLGGDGSQGGLFCERRS